MRRIVSLFLTIGFIYIAYGLFISQWRPRIIDLQTSSITKSHYFDYSGAINIRTIQSSGSGYFDQVTRAASEAQLDFVVITDFNDFSIDINRAPYSNNVLTIPGGSYSYLDARILNIDMNTREHLQGPGRSQMLFADLLSRRNSMRPEGLFILSHPFKSGYKLNGPMPVGLDGIELINLKNVWQDSWFRSKPAFLWTALVYPFNSNLAFLRMLQHAGQKEIELWDKLNQSQLSFGIFGSAAEARLRLFGEHYIPFPSYETTLAIVRNHVLLKSELTGQAELDQKKMSTALRKGQFYMSFDLLGDPSGYYTHIDNKRGDITMMGGEMQFQPNLELVVYLPQKPLIPFEIVIYKNGEPLVTSNSQETIYRIQGPGSYRSVVKVEVPLPLPDGKTWMPWILSNPILVK